MRKTKNGFTLAELLIIVGVIGIVAVLTIPGLINEIGNKIKANKMKVIETKVVKAVNIFNNQENGFNASYNSTEDFVRAFSKYMKIAKICDQSNLKDCFPYDTMRYETSTGTIESKPLAEIQSGRDMNMRVGNFADTAAFVTIDGTPFLVSYDLNCHSIDSDIPQKNIPACIVGFYDIDPNRNSNFQGDSVVMFNGAGFGDCSFKLGNVCFSSYPFRPTPPSSAECNQLKEDGIITANVSDCPTNYWAGAAKACGGYKNLPSLNYFLIEVKQYLYPMDKHKQEWAKLGLTPPFRMHTSNQSQWAIYPAKFTSTELGGDLNVPMAQTSRTYDIYAICK